MFNNPAGKLRVFAVILFVLDIISAALLLLAGLGLGMGFEGLIYIAVLVFSGLVGCMSLCALADAAEHAKTAAYYSEQIAMYINRQERNKEEAEMPDTPQAAWHPDGKLPAWQRVELEKEEAARKAAQESQQ